MHLEKIPLFTHDKFTRPHMKLAKHYTKLMREYQLLLRSEL
jgi:hypothetical protein